MRTLLSIGLTVLLLFSLQPTAVAEEAETSIITAGLVAHYDGILNVGDGHDPAATVWKDLTGNGHDMALILSAPSQWKENALYLQNAQQRLPQALSALVNGNAFTVELSLGEARFTASAYASLLRSENDNFSLFLRMAGDFIEFKASGNARPKVMEGSNYAENSTAAITFQRGGDIKLYIDGECIGTAAAKSTLSADALYLCDSSNDRKWQGDIYAIRFYDRALTSAEIYQNANADWVNYRGVSLAEKPPEDVGIVMTESVETGLFTAPALITEVRTREDAEALASLKPNTAIFHADSSGRTLLGTAAETAAFCEGIIPAFEVDSKEAVLATIESLQKDEVIDYFIVAADPSLLDLAISTDIWARTVLRVDERWQTPNSWDLPAIRDSANAVGCHVVVLPEVLCDRYHTDYFQRRLMGIWVIAPAAEHGVMQGILSGGNGMVTQDIALAKAMLREDFPVPTMTRQVYIIGHRGLPGSYPENTIEGALAAVEAGADMVELDIVMTSDGEIIVSHDGTADRTTNGTGSIAAMTLEEVRSFTIDTHAKYPGLQLPTLAEFFEAWTQVNADKQLFIEIKSSDAKLIGRLAELIRTYDMTQRASVITFSQSQQKRLHAALPEISIGHLTGSLLSSDTPRNLKAIIRTVQQLEGTFNHNKDGITKEYYQQLNAHGITHWPYTYGQQAQFAEHFLYGLNGLTTDYSNWVTHTVKHCITGGSLQTTEITLNVGDTLEDVFSAVTYSGANAFGSRIAVVSGESVISVNRNDLTAQQPGEAYIYGYCTTVVANQPFRATSGLIRVIVREP